MDGNPNLPRGPLTYITKVVGLHDEVYILYYICMRTHTEGGSLNTWWWERVSEMQITTHRSQREMGIAEFSSVAPRRAVVAMMMVVAEESHEEGDHAGRTWAHDESPRFFSGHVSR